MNKNQELAWKAVCELGDYFSRLGGAARPFNMAESEIFLYVCSKTLEINGKPIVASEVLYDDFIKAAKPIISKVDAFLTQINIPAPQVVTFVHGFYIFADKKLKDTDKTTRWIKFGQYLSENDV